MKNNPTSIVVHTSDVSYRTQFDQFNNINSYHRDVRQFPASSLAIFVGYHSLITGNARTQKWSLIRCRADEDIGAHCNQGYDGVKIYPPNTGQLSMNYQSLGVCVGFDGDIEMVPLEAYSLLQKQIWEWQDKYKIPNNKVFFHRKFATDKTCPGSLITDQWLADLLKRPLPVPGVPKENQCLIEKVVIENQKKEISGLKAILQTIFNLIKL